MIPTGLRVLLPVAGSILAGFVSFAYAEPTHGLAMHGAPKLPADFKNFSYVNPDAPKGGRVNYAWPGTFDSVNPFIIQGTGTRGPLDLIFGDLVYDRLMMRSMDEPFTLYPLIAKSVETDDDRTYIAFQIDERAKFSDGHPLTVDDVIFSFNLLRDKGYPVFSNPYKKIKEVVSDGPGHVKFVFKDPDRELPLIIARLPVLPKHLTNPDTFDKSTLTPMVGSGPYITSDVKPGASVTFKRNPDYWAKDLPSKKGFDNYDEVKISYFTDENAMFEAFRKGLVDVFPEKNANRWKNDYNFPALQRGEVVQDSFEDKMPSGMYGIVMNTQRPIFTDQAFRAALTQTFDFEWVNRNLLSDSYQRTKSFFDNSDLSTNGVPASDAERKLLEPFPGAVSAEIMEKGWTAPQSDGTGRDRNMLRGAFDQLKAAGYKLQDRALVDPQGKPVTFEIMLNGKEGESLAIAWQQVLNRVGIQVNVRSVDSSQFVRRQNERDYDAMFFNYTSSMSPGIEQNNRWGSGSAGVAGTFNFANVKNPAIDAMIAKFLAAKSREEFADAVRAYDRVLMSGSYLVPLYYRPGQWVGRWAYIKHPEMTPIQGPQFSTWWRQDK